MLMSYTADSQQLTRCAATPYIHVLHTLETCGDIWRMTLKQKPRCEDAAEINETYRGFCLPRANF